MGQVQSAKILFLGLDNAGKSSIISYFESRGEVVAAEEPTVGFKEKDIKFKGVNFKIWDVAGKENVRGLWKHYYAEKDGIVYVLDSSNPQKLDEGIQQLKMIFGRTRTPKLYLACACQQTRHSKLCRSRGDQTTPSTFCWREESLGCLPSNNKSARR
eukprot:TRINITY_DN5892_c0_g6_i1.p1 TRINITY_DN5892_c0_g6~~TRINITY_DN5892_c0_g6_i1.p1  ORF type:complete len:157 (-),score=43.94 TRINITY_DN5892_c0_g6_i1:127-597(-)